MKMMKIKSNIFFIFAAVFFLCSYSSSLFAENEGDEKKTTEDKQNSKSQMATLEHKIEVLQKRLSELEIDEEISKKIIGISKTEIESLKEQIMTNQKNIEILKRGIKSGVFEDFSKKETMLPDLATGRGRTIDVDLFSEPNKNTDEKTLNPEILLDRAEKHLQSQNYTESIEQINLIRKHFPNFKDGGKVYILAAESWLKLKKNENVIPELSSFYIKNQKSPLIPRAKTIEAQSYEQMGRFQKATQLYTEIIALSPKSEYAKNARTALIRIRDSEF